MEEQDQGQSGPEKHEAHKLEAVLDATRHALELGERDERRFGQGGLIGAGYAALSARIVRPGLFMADVDFEIKGLPRDAGPIQGRALVLRVLESGVWKIVAERSFSMTPVTK